MDKSVYDIIKEHVITEKSNIMMSEGKYTFRVAVDSNKIEIKKAVEQIYKAKVQSVNIMKMSGKKVRYGRYAGKKPDWKKAFVTLKKGEKIEELTA